MHFGEWAVVSLAYISLSLLQQCFAAPVLSYKQITLKDSISANSITSALKRADIIPDILDDFSPTFSLSLSYPSNHRTVSLGNKIPPSDTSTAPIFEIHSLSSPSSLSPTRTLASNKTYTLVLSDPDATSRADPVKGQMCHWIATGISLTSRNSSEGIEEESAYTLEMYPHAEGVVGNVVKQLMDYLQPAPPKGTGKHRYVFVLLASEDGGEGKKELTKPEARPHWGYGTMGKGVREWAAENNLVTVGANFFYAKYHKS